RNAMRKILLMSLLLSPTLLIGQIEKLTLNDLVSGASGGSVRGHGEGQLSPDGKYALSLENGRIALKPIDGSPEKILASSSEPKSESQWSKDSKHIAYISQGNVWVVAVADGEPRQLTHDPKGPGDPRGATDHHPQWNPNGTWILYESGRKGYNELYAVSEDGKVRNLLAATEI